jgi:hypothetical protein
MHPLEERIDCFSIQKVVHSFEAQGNTRLEFMEAKQGVFFKEKKVSYLCSWRLRFTMLRGSFKPSAN